MTTNTAQTFQVAFYEKLSRQLRNKLVYHNNPIFVFGRKYHHYEHPTLGTYISIERLVRNTAVYKPKTHIKIISHSIPVLQNELEQIQCHLKMQDQLFGFTKDEQEIMKNLLDNRFDLIDSSTEFTEPTKMTGILSTPPPSPPVDPNVISNKTQQLVISTNSPQLKIGALASAEPAYPRGNFATKAEYENYVNLQINGRTQAAIDYAAAMVAPHVHDPRNPFPHGHCYLLLFKPEQRVNIYQRGQDFLTKEILVNNSAHLDLKRRVMLHLQRATNDAHISMVKDPPDNDSIIVQVDFLSTKLLKAFDDSIVDFDELEEIFFSAPLVTRY